MMARRSHEQDFRQAATAFDEGVRHGLLICERIRQRGGKGIFNMKYRVPALFAAMLFSSMPLATPVAAKTSASAQSVVDELLAADRGFSASGAKLNIADAIAAMLADDAIMPTPQGSFADGKAAIVAALRANPANANATARWEPVRGGVSADGLHGFTYGFMTISEPGKPDRRAKYLSYWIRNAKGWQVAGYKRAGSAAGDVKTELRSAALPPHMVAPTKSDKKIEAHRASLAAAEKAFSDRSKIVGIGPAFVENGSPDAMNMGSSADFTFSNTAIGAAVGTGFTGPSVIHWAGDHKVLVASSGDLGVTFGTIYRDRPPAEGPASFPFFTIWRRAAPDQAWRYVAE